ncbi:O-antigen ligase family protein [Candidatus Bealeia paramacronuclearis]|uniref:O-antigen ligase family protein n=1 Tax=Candidatus Bealeia paramacronuclearis TaxID=1921001 RepID=A0ABZ2C335_9PROT|nr:O-antigen ligase family protein [Candidatus Bealeia paramacronuclearis]
MNSLHLIKTKISQIPKDFFNWGALAFLFLISMIFHKFAALYIGIAAISLFLLCKKSITKDFYSLFLTVPLQLFLSLWVWAGITLFWTTNFENGADTWYKILLIGFFGTVLFSTLKNLEKEQLKKIVYFCIFALCGIIGFYIFIKIRGIVIEKPLAYFFALMFFPTFCFLWQTKKLYNYVFMGIYFLFALYVMKNSDAKSAFIGFVLGGGVFLLTLYKSDLTSKLLKYGSFLFILLSPLFSYFLLANPQRLLVYMKDSLTSLYHRLLIWNFVSLKIVEKPLLGWGLGASKNFPGGNDFAFKDLPLSEGQYLKIFYQYFGGNPFAINNLPLHPHNNPLQVFLELGIPGGILYSLFILSIFKLFRLTFHNKVTLASANAMAILTLVICNMSHSAWHIWILSWIVLSFGLLFVVHRLNVLSSPKV